MFASVCSSVNVCESVTTEDGFKMLLWAGYAPVSGAPPSYRPPVAPPPSSNGPTQYFSNNGPSQSQYSTSNGAPQVSALFLLDIHSPFFFILVCILVERGCDVQKLFDWCNKSRTLFVCWATAISELLLHLAPPSVRPLLYYFLCLLIILITRAVGSRSLCQKELFSNLTWPLLRS